MGKKTIRKAGTFGGLGTSVATTLYSHNKDREDRKERARADEIARKEALEQKRIAKEEDIASRKNRRSGLSDLMSIE